MSGSSGQNWRNHRKTAKAGRRPVHYCCYATWRWHCVEWRIPLADMGNRAKPIATLEASGFVGSLIAMAQFPTLNGDFPRIELQIEPSTQLVGNRSSTLKPINLSGQTFNGDEESHG